jgi:hypothetical protein
VIKSSKPARKPSVELRPSRIRRDPPALPARLDKAALPDLEERETWLVVVGVILFGLAFMIITIGFSDITSR